MERGTIIRSVILMVALMNQVLVTFGKSPIPFNTEEIEQATSLTFTIGASLVAWFKDNAVTKKGVVQQQYLKDGGLK